MITLENFKAFINKTKEKLNKVMKTIKEIYNKNIFKIILWAQFALTIVLTILLINSMIMTKNLSKQVTDISNQYNTIITSINTQNSAKGDTDKPTETKTESDTKTDDKSTSSKSTSSKSTSSKTTSSKPATSTSSTNHSSSSSTSSTKPASSTVTLGTTTDLDLLAIVIFQETGGNSHCDTCRRRVADVVLNRVASSKYPNTIKGVLTQKGQYGRLYYTGIKWPSRATKAGEKKAVERAYRIAEEVLNGQHSELYGKGYIYQAGFKQGKTNIYCCGHYFGK